MENNKKELRTAIDAMIDQAKTLRKMEKELGMSFVVSGTIVIFQLDDFESYAKSLGVDKIETKPIDWSNLTGNKYYSMFTHEGTEFVHYHKEEIWRENSLGLEQ